MSTRLDPDVVALLRQLDDTAPVSPEAGPDERRAAFAGLMALLHPGTGTGFAGAVREGSVPSIHGEIPIRTYDPEGGTADEIVVFVHGGGWVLGDLDSAHPAASAIAAQMGLRVVSVRYRLAPEHPHPSAFDDCVAVVRSVVDAGARWVGLAGDSAGGHLAAAVAVAAAGEGREIGGQLLFYPALDPGMGSPSYDEFAEGHLLTRDAMRYYWSAYRGSAGADEVALSPWNAPTLAPMPPTVIAVAGHDPLRDEGVEFARRLITDGVPTTFLPSPALIHGWVDQTERIPAARRAFVDAVAAFDDLRVRRGVRS